MNWVPIISLGANLILALIVYSLKSTIRIAILELQGSLSDKYASKVFVDDRVKLGERIDNGFAKVHQLFDREKGSLSR